MRGLNAERPPPRFGERRPSNRASAKVAGHSTSEVGTTASTRKLVTWSSTQSDVPIAMCPRWPEVTSTLFSKVSAISTDHS